MPFTLAHPAAVLPFRRIPSGPLVWSALVIGSMTPDFEYFIHLSPRSDISHTAIGTLLFCLPAGLIVYSLFHAVIKQPAVLLLPQFHRQALWPLATATRPLTVNHALAVAASLFIGAWTHLIWDSFTHPYGWAVQHWNSLQATVFQIGGYSVGAYKLRQQLSAVFGLAVLGVFYFRWLRKATRQPSAQAPAFGMPVQAAAWSFVIASAVVPGTMLALKAAGGRTGFIALQNAAVQFAIGGIAGTAASLLAFSLFANLLWNGIIRKPE